MLQDADCAIRFSTQLFFLKPFGSLVLASGLLLSACVGTGGESETRIVDQAYLSASTEPASGSGDEAESPFEQIQREMFAGDESDNNGSEPAVVSLEDFDAMLENYGEDLAKGTLEDAGEADVTTNRSAVLETEAVRPRVFWQAVQEPNGEGGPVTPADRVSLIGSAKDPSRIHETDRKPGIEKIEGADADPGRAEVTGRERSAKAFSLDEMVVMLSGQLHRNAAYSNVPLREYIVDASMLALDPERRIDPKELYNLNERERELLADLQEFFMEVGKQLRETRDPETIIEAVNKLARGLGTVYREGGLRNDRFYIVVVYRPLRE